SPKPKAQSHRANRAATSAGSFRTGPAEFSGEIKTVTGDSISNFTRRTNAFENGLLAGISSQSRSPGERDRNSIGNSTQSATRNPQPAITHAVAQRPAPARRRHRQTLRPARIRPWTRAAGPARGA